MALTDRKTTTVIRQPELVPLRGGGRRSTGIAPSGVTSLRMTPDTLLAKRYELKYRVPESIAIAVREFARAFVQPDPFTLSRPDRMYSISSLYLDSPQFHLFHETQLDKCNRYKLRIRTYDDSPVSPAFFEIKRKLNTNIYKSRVKLPKDSIGEILRGGDVPEEMTSEDRTVLRQFQHYCRCLQARPIVRVRYRREAYESLSRNRVRITFDRELAYQPATEPVVRLNGPGWRTLPIDFVVLEIKFSDSFPLWVKQLVQTFNLNRQSMSKYCRSAGQMMAVPAW